MSSPCVALLYKEHVYRHEFLTMYGVWSSAEYGQHKVIHCRLLNLHYKTTSATQCIVSEKIARLPIKKMWNHKCKLNRCTNLLNLQFWNLPHCVPSFNDWLFTGLLESIRTPNAVTPIPILLPYYSQKKKYMAVCLISKFNNDFAPWNQRQTITGSFQLFKRN